MFCSAAHFPKLFDPARARFHFVKVCGSSPARSGFVPSTKPARSASTQFFASWIEEFRSDFNRSTRLRRAYGGQASILFIRTKMERSKHSARRETGDSSAFTICRLHIGKQA